MKPNKEPLQDYLRRRLNESIGLHNTIAKATGVRQSTVSRIHLGKVSPSLNTVQPLLDWFSEQDKLAVKRARKVTARRPAAGAPPALSQ